MDCEQIGFVHWPIVLCDANDLGNERVVWEATAAGADTGEKGVAFDSAARHAVNPTLAGVKVS